jgi:thioredoxin-related protein
LPADSAPVRGRAFACDHAGRNIRAAPSRLHRGQLATRPNIDELSRVKTYRRALLVAALSSLASLTARAEPAWSSDFNKAQAEAKASHKLLLLDFTGSDWCIWCKKLDAEVFSQAEFEKYAKDHLVLVTIDFPRGKTLRPEVKKQNEELAQKFGIQGFPTIVVLDGSGKQVGELGYEPGGAPAFVDELKKLPQS